MKAGSIGMKMACYFVRNPDEELTAQDVRVRWNMPHFQHRNLKAMLEGNLLVARTADDLDANPVRVYSAGPALLAAMEV